MSAKNDTLHINFTGPKRATGEFTVHYFTDHDHFITYIPSLNLSAYGESEEEAFDRLINEVFDDFMRNLTALKPEEAANELKKLGWSKSRFFKKRFSSDSYVDRNGVLKNFNLPQETQVDTRVVTV